MKRVLAHGTFDIIHHGHIRYLEKAKSYGDYLIVLVTSDDLVKLLKHKETFFNEEIRKKVISSLKCVDEVIIRNEHISAKYIKDLNIDTFVTIYPQYNKLKDNCNVRIVERTKGISTTDIKNYLSSSNKTN